MYADQGIFETNYSGNDSSLKNYLPAILHLRLKQKKRVNMIKIKLESGYSSSLRFRQP